MKKKLLASGWLLLASALMQPVAAEGIERFRIEHFAVEGNTLLTAGRIETLLAPYTGQGKVYGDVQRALETLENAYRSTGYNTVRVYVPEQELTQGNVRLVVSEGIIGKVVISGNQHFSEANVRAALPALKEGSVPNARLLSENIQLANDNPARQLAVTLGVGEEEKSINARVTVADENPQKVVVTLDNTGTPATGRYRTGIAYQHANLFQSDQMLTLAYTTAPDAPDGVKVDVYSLAYRLPLYAFGDSIDLIYGNSNVNTPSAQATGFGLAGKGDVTALRYNHYFPRQGEFSARLSLGIDYKYFNTRCSINGVSLPIDPPLPALASCTPYTTRPLSATYAGQWQGAGAVADYNLGIAYNLPLGSRYEFRGGMDHYSTIANRAVSDNFTIVRFGANYMTTLFSDWQARVAFSGQYSNNGLVAGEQFGMAGSTAVRGFGERAVAADTGHVANVEAYTPELARIMNIPGNLRGVLFYDLARGKNLGVQAATTGSADRLGIAAAGLGLRYNFQKSVSVRADVAGVTKAGPVGTESRGDWLGHVNMSYSF